MTPFIQTVSVPNRPAAGALALAASSSRFFGVAVVSSDRSSRPESPAISSMAARNAASLAFDGLLKPVIFLTNWSDAACTSSGVTGGSKLKSVLIFLHIKHRPQSFKWNHRRRRDIEITENGHTFLEFVVSSGVLRVSVSPW